MKIIDWIQESGYRDGFIAEKLGISKEYLQLMKLEKRIPSKILAKSIQNLTNGKVTLKDLSIQKEEKKEEENGQQQQV